MTENKYSNGKIYKVVDNAYTKCYIGSTIEPLCKRMAKHRRDYNLYKQGKKLFYTIYSLFDEYGTENCKIELLEAYPCNNIEELHKHEGEHIKYNDCLNKRVEGRTDKDRRLAKPETYKAIAKRYQESHKEQIATYAKDYSARNSEIIKEKKRLYDLANRDIRLELIKCDCCPGRYVRQNKRRHERTVLHQEALKLKYLDG